LETKDERLNEVKDDLWQKNKQLAAAGELQAKAIVAKEQRKINKDIVANNDTLEATHDEVAKLASTLERDSRVYRSCQ